MNCMIMKMKNACPPIRGSSSGQNVFSKPSLVNRMYSGITCTWIGSISVISIIMNQNLRPTNRRRAKPYAVSALAQTTSIVPTPRSRSASCGRT